MTAIGVWSVVVSPGEPCVVTPQADLRITSVALGDELVDESGRTTLKLNYESPHAESDSDDDEDEEKSEEDEDEHVLTTVVCSLTPGKIESVTTDFTLMDQVDYLFEAIGKNSLYLIGNYIDQSPAGGAFGMEDSDEESDEEGYALEDVSSDVEINPEDLEMDSDASRFEEVVEEDPKSLKRSREADVDEPKPSKAEKKKNKKLKAENGEAVPTGEEQTDKKDKKKEKEDKKKGKDGKDKDGKEKEKEKKKPVTRELNGIKITDSKIGTGPAAKKGQTVQMRYIGKLNNGNTFDKNVKGAPFKFRLGAGEVIKGWDLGVPGMQVGGERVLVIPPELAYGKKKMGDIPANSTLTFEVKLVSIR